MGGKSISLKSLRSVLGGSPLYPFLSASHFVVPDLSVTVLCCLESCVPLPSPFPCAPQPPPLRSPAQLHFPLLFRSSGFLYSMLSAEEGPCRELWVSLCTGSGVEGLLGTPNPYRRGLWVYPRRYAICLLLGSQPPWDKHQSPCPWLMPRSCFTLWTLN